MGSVEFISIVSPIMFMLLMYTVKTWTKS